MFMRRDVRAVLAHLLIVLGVVAGLTGGIALPAGASGSGHETGTPHTPGAVFTMSNDAQGNSLLVFDRRTDGSLVPGTPVATGGLGSGAGLGTQGAVVMSDDERWLLAVNPGSDDVSLFSLHGGRPTLVDVAPSGGDGPASVTVRHGLVYVLNAGDDTISALRIRHHDLEPVAGSTRHLSGSGVGAAQVELSPDGRQLVVTEKNTDLIDVFPVDAQGQAGAAVANPSNGVTPFGFAFDSRNRLIVSNANGGALDASSLTSYELTRTGTTVSVDGPEATTETAACWVVVTRDGRFTYTTNTGSGSITGFSIGHDGSLTILDADGVTATTGAGPIDLGLTGDSHFLYTLSSGSDSISIHRVESDGSLTALGTVSGLPAATVGLAAS